MLIFLNILRLGLFILLRIGSTSLFRLDTATIGLYIKCILQTSSDAKKNKKTMVLTPIITYLPCGI